MTEPAAGALDSGQYTPHEIQKYEAVYGRNFISPGGEATTRAILGLIQPQPGMQALDIGCGLGGAAFVLARSFGARMHAIDLSLNMLAIAQARCREAGLADMVSFEHANILHYDRPASYDLAHSRDVFLHIHDKAGLFAAIWRCLRPGGRLLFSDYLCRAGPRSPEFAAYIHARQYDLRSLGEYQDLLERAGFVVVDAQDRTGEFARILERELVAIRTAELGAQDRVELAQSWRAKLKRARAGEQRWGVFLAAKPAA